VTFFMNKKSILVSDRVSTKAIFYTRLNRNFILISSKFRCFAFRNFDVEIGISISGSLWKSEFRFRVRCGNRNFGFWIGIFIPTSEFRFRNQVSISMSKFQSIFYWNKSTFIFWLLFGILMSTIEIKIDISITCDNFDEVISSKVKINFDRNCDRNSDEKLISVETQVIVS
jgi:hypothetical protein